MTQSNYEPITQVSCAVPKLTLLDRQNDVISPATGFFFRWGTRTFLVSNWHVFSGKNSQTGESLTGNRREPWTVLADARFAPSDGLSAPTQIRIPLRRPEDGDRLWAEHSLFGRSVDVAAIEIVGLPQLQLHFANDDICDRPFIWGVGDRMFILGYPKGVSGGQNLPIWKSATVASEPGQWIDSQPKFLVDAATTGGMSGSPVLFRSETYKVPGEGGFEDQAMFSMGATVQQLVGIYSGRVALLDKDLKDDPLAAQLGFVWRRETIVDVVIAAAKLRDNLILDTVRFATLEPTAFHDSENAISKPKSPE